MHVHIVLHIYRAHAKEMIFSFISSQVDQSHSISKQSRTNGEAKVLQLNIKIGAIATQ